MLTPDRISAFFSEPDVDQIIEAFTALPPPVRQTAIAYLHSLATALSQAQPQPTVAQAAQFEAAPEPSTYELDVVEDDDQRGDVQQDGEWDSKIKRVTDLRNEGLPPSKIAARLKMTGEEVNAILRLVGKHRPHNKKLSPEMSEHIRRRAVAMRLVNNTPTQIAKRLTKEINTLVPVTTIYNIIWEARRSGTVFPDLRRPGPQELQARTRMRQTA